MTPTPDNVHVVLLAAGVSRRFGGDKRCAVLPTGRTLLQQACHVLETSGLRYSIACRPDDPVVRSYPQTLPLVESANGMGASIAAAVARIGSAPSAIMVLPADLPLLRASTLLAVAEHSDLDRIVRPSNQGQYGHPVSFGRQFFRDLMQLGGEGGARSVIDAHPDQLVALAVSDPGILCDIDTPRALRELRLSQFPAEHR